MLQPGPVKRPAQAAFSAAELALPASAEPKASTSLKLGELPEPSAASSQPGAQAAESDGADPILQTAAPAGAPAEFKALEAMQPAQSPIDLSALAQQTAARAEPSRTLLAPEQPAAPSPTGTNGQSASAGQPTPLHVVPIEIGLRALAGARQFDIRLDPDELGRVDVSLSISDNGEINARLVVDRVETLHLLQRDARTLERAFEQAGLKPSDSGVDISLRNPADQSGFRQNRQQDEAPRRARTGSDGPAGDDAVGPVDSAPPRRLVRLGGVDLSI
jgi:flagellar hook-length control protein FliK